jgi:hypothetical protein
VKISLLGVLAVAVSAIVANCAQSNNKPINVHTVIADATSDYCKIPYAARLTAHKAAMDAAAVALVAGTQGTAAPYAGLMSGIPLLVHCEGDPQQ